MYSASSPSQKFYIGNHGAVYSSACPGLAISHQGACDQGLSNVQLRMYKNNDKGMKWEYKNDGNLVSAKCQDYVIGRNVGGNFIEITQYTEGDANQRWRRKNTHLLPANTGDEWNQKWTGSFCYFRFFQNANQN